MSTPPHAATLDRALRAAASSFFVISHLTFSGLISLVDRIAFRGYSLEYIVTRRGYPPARRRSPSLKFFFFSFSLFFSFSHTHMYLLYRSPLQLSASRPLSCDPSRSRYMPPRVIHTNQCSVCIHI